MEFVSWDYEIPNLWENKIHVPNHQPVIDCFTWFDWAEYMLRESGL
jgi:hypothetical protein